MHGYYGYGFGFGHLGMMLLWIVIIAGVIWMVFSSRGCASGGCATRHYASDRSASAEEETPLAIARKRYARGEITLDEFNEIKRHL